MNKDEIAVIGMACRFPKSNSISEFWDNLCHGNNCLTYFNQSDLIQAGYTKEIINKPNFVAVKGILNEVDQFDAAFFGLSPQEASILDPQQRLFFECAWEALEHSANVPNKINNAIISVFAGMADSSYLQENLLKNDWFRQHHNWFQTRVATSIGTLSTQLSYRLNLQGNSININTACSTGLVATIQGCQDLLAGRSDIALVGSVAIELPQIKGYFYEMGSIDSPDGYCRPFDHHANGTVFSNGVGVVVLKRLKAAIADHDTIYAVIQGYGINNDGADKLNYFAPSVNGQVNCIKDALTHAEISPEAIGYVEGHGTATALGDVIEVTALTQAYRQFTEKTQYCALGSVKGNIGHTDIAAGMAGLIKTVLSLHHQKIPKTLHFEAPNPELSLEKSPFYVNRELISWDPIKKNQQAAVSAFGVGGTNAHIILRAHDNPKVVEKQLDTVELLLFSAKSPLALQENIANIKKYLKEEEKKVCFHDVAHTLRVGRDEFNWRSFTVAENLEEMITVLDKPLLMPCTKEKPNIVFMFPGQGSQYWQMTTQLYQRIDLFREIMDKASILIESYLQIDIRTLLFGENEDPRIVNTIYAQPILFTIEYALAQLLIQSGIKPTALVGHSSGEYVAACLAGVFSFEDALFLICQRGQLMETTAKGEMIAITCSLDEFKHYQQDFDIELASNNTQNHCVATGTLNAMRAFKVYLNTQSKPYRILKVNYAFHSRTMETIESNFCQLFSKINLKPTQLPIISNVSGEKLTDEKAMDPEYWYQHLRSPVQFKKSIDFLMGQNCDFFIEVGAGRGLSHFVQEVMKLHESKCTAISLLPDFRQPTMDYSHFLKALGRIWQLGIQLNWNVFIKTRYQRRIALPAYSFQRQRYWLEPDSSTLLTYEADNNPKLFQPSWCRYDCYEADEIQGDPTQYRWIIFKDSLGLANELIYWLKQRPVKLIIVEGGDHYKKIDSTCYQLNCAHKEDYLALFEDLKTQGVSSLMGVHLFSYQKHSELVSNKTFDEGLDLGFYSLLYLTQAYLQNFNEDASFKCAVITCGTQRVFSTDISIPVNATLTGPCRVVAREHSTIQYRLMDVPLITTHYSSLAKALINHCLHEWDKKQPIIAFRQGYLWEPHYLLVSHTQKIQRLKDNGVYLFTGGLGGIALTLCEAIAQSVLAPVCILVSRSLFPERTEWRAILGDVKQSRLHQKIKKIQKLELLGAKVIIKSVDITDKNSLQNLIQDILNEYGCLNGVIHAAGLPGGGVVQLKTKAMANAVLAPKAHGTYCLAQTLKNLSLDFVLLCSSMSALLSEPGQIDYCGANACLDAFATSDLFNGSKLTVSVNWNTWKEVGMAVEVERPSDVVLLDQGNEITPEQGQQLFLQILQNNISQVIVSNSEIEICTKAVWQTTQSNAPNKVDRSALQIENIYEPPRNAIEKKLAHIWQNILGIEKISIHDGFFDLGGHSLRAIQLIAQMNKHFNSRLVLQDLYSQPSIAQLAQKLSNIKIENNKASEIIVPLKLDKTHPLKLFLCHPVSGMTFCYEEFCSKWHEPGSLYGLQDPSIMTGKLVFQDLRLMAESYLNAIKQVQPDPPYYLIGYSFGATLMYEIAYLLKQRGESIGLLAMIDGWAIFSSKQSDEQLFKQALRCYHPNLTDLHVDLAWERMQLLLRHRPHSFKQKMILFKAKKLISEYQEIEDCYNGWRQFNSGKIICLPMAADHETIMQGSQLEIIIRTLQEKMVALID